MLIITSRMLMVCVCVCVHSGNQDAQTDGGNTALHYCCLYDKPQCVKLLLRGNPDVHVGESAPIRKTLCPDSLRSSAAFP